MTNTTAFKANIPDAPVAPIHYNNHEASAWQSGWESGYGAYSNQYDATVTLLRNTVDYQYVRIRELESACEKQSGGIPPVAAEIYMDSAHFQNGNMWRWEIRNIYNKSSVFTSGENSDANLAFSNATASLQAVQNVFEKTAGEIGVDGVKRWQDRISHSGLQSVSHDDQMLAMQAEIESLRAYAKGLEAGADHLHKVVAELRSVQPTLPKPVAYRYSTTGMWEYATRRETAVEERLAHEKYHADDPDMEHEEPEALYTEAQVMSLFSGISAQ